MIMSGKSKCDHCTLHGKHCVQKSWESINCACSQLNQEISKTTADLAVLSAKLLHLQRTLDQINKIADEKTECLVTELADDNTSDSELDFNAAVNFLSDDFWQ